MSFIDYSAIKATDSGPITFYIYQEVFLRGNLDDLLIINKAVKSIGKVRNRVLLAFLTIPLIMTDNDWLKVECTQNPEVVTLAITWTLFTFQYTQLDSYRITLTGLGNSISSTSVVEEFECQLPFEKSATNPECGKYIFLDKLWGLESFYCPSNTFNYCSIFKFQPDPTSFNGSRANCP